MKAVLACLISCALMTQAVAQTSQKRSSVSQFSAELARNLSDALAQLDEAQAKIKDLEDELAKLKKPSGQKDNVDPP
jgi:uncharacterized protein YlxW (UPF0749 family)